MPSKINKNKVSAAAQKFVQKGQFDKAIKEYAKIVEEDPRDVRIWLKIGDLHGKRGSTHEAVETYSKVAEYYSEQGFYLKAVAVYKQILKIDTALVDVNLRLAELYKQLGLLSDAMQQYEQVSNYYSQEGRTKEALAALRQIVDLDPENVASRIKLAELYSKEAMRDEAVEEFAKAADFLRADNRIDDFVKVAERLVFHQPDNMTVTRELAGIYLRRRDPRRALQKLQLAFKADPRDVETLEMLAQAFEDLGQTAKTVSVLKELVSIHTEHGQQTKLRETWERVLRLSPDDPEAHAFLGNGGARIAAPPAAPAINPRRDIFGDSPESVPHFTTAQNPLYDPQPRPAPAARLESPRTGPARAFVPAGHPPPERPAAEFAPPPELDDDGAADPFRAPTPYVPDDGFPPPTDDFPDDPVYGRRYDAPADAYVPPNHYEAPEHLDDMDLASLGLAEPQAEGEREGTPLADNLSGRVPAREPLSTGSDGRGLGDFAAGDPADDVAKIITEADVYLKYGLQDKAVNHLLQVFEHDPQNVEVHLKLSEVFSHLGRYHEAAQELVELARFAMDNDRRQAAQWLNEALELDRESREARALLRTLERGTGASYEAVAADDDDFGIPPEELGEPEEPLDLDPLDIVEEIPVDADDLLEGSGITPMGGDSDDEDSTAATTDAAWGGGRSRYTHDTSTANVSLSGPSEPTPLATTLSAVIEVESEDPSAYGEQTAPSEVIPLGEASVPAIKAREHREEESLQIEDELDEADFFIQQQLYGEARAILEELLSHAPKHPLLAAKLADLEAAERGAAPESLPAEPDEDLGSTLADELSAELSDSDFPAFPDDDGRPRNYTVEDVFDEFKRGSESTVDDEDSDTHYDLGIAYREMGLLDDAIGEFKIAMKSREKEVLCHMMIGLCFIEKEMLSEAISQFKTGLYVEGITDRETIALYFELGQSYERLDDLKEALYYYEKVAKKDPKFREVTDRMRDIRRALGEEPAPTPPVGVNRNGGGNPGGAGDGDVVSTGGMGGAR